MGSPVGILLSLLLASIGLNSCASSNTEHIAVSGRDRGVVRNNKAQPDWAVNLNKPADDSRVFVVSSFEGGGNLSVSINQAKTIALGSLSQLVAAKIESEERSSIAGDATIDEGTMADFSSSIAVVSSQKISGARVEDIYWEEVKPEDSSVSRYNVSVLVALPRREYERLASIFKKQHNGANRQDTSSGKSKSDFDSENADSYD